MKYIILVRVKSQTWRCSLKLALRLEWVTTEGRDPDEFWPPVSPLLRNTQRRRGGQGRVDQRCVMDIKRIPRYTLYSIPLSCHKWTDTSKYGTQGSPTNLTVAEIGRIVLPGLSSSSDWKRTPRKHPRYLHDTTKEREGKENWTRLRREKI